MPYLAHFGLREHPFSLTPNTERYFPTSGKTQVLQSLEYGIRRSAGIMKVVGDVGTGKTLLCRLLLRQLAGGQGTSGQGADSQPDASGIAYLNAPQAEGDPLIALVCHEFGLPVGDRAAMLRGLNEFLLARHADGHDTVLVVDEAQALGATGLETVRLLSNLETERAKLLQIVLFGQTELDDLLARPDLRQINQRIAFSFISGPFSRAEIGAYVKHCLRVSRLDGVAYDIFEPKALDEIARASAGVPRVINILCDKALLIAYGDGARAVTRAHARAAVADSPTIVAGVGPRPIQAGGTGAGWKWAAAAMLLVLATGLAAAGWHFGIDRVVNAAAPVAPLAPPEPVPEPVAEPEPAPPPQPQPEPEPEPVPEPEPEAVPEPVPSPVPDLTLETEAAPASIPAAMMDAAPALAPEPGAQRHLPVPQAKPVVVFLPAKAPPAPVSAPPPSPRPAVTVRRVEVRTITPDFAPADTPNAATPLPANPAPATPAAARPSANGSWEWR